MQPTAVSATLHTPSLFGLTDIDSDGDLDIRLTGDSSIVVLENQGGQFVFCEFCHKENHSWVSQVDDDPTGDVDGDGVAEFFTAGVTAVGCGALLGEGVYRQLWNRSAGRLHWDHRLRHPTG